jgi:hypothetical protein
VVGSLATAAVLLFLLAGRRDEFAAALSVAAWVLAVTVLLQIVALLARSEAWHLTIRAAGGTVDRRVLYRASSMGVLGGLLNAQAAVAARIAALRRSSPDVSPQVPTLIAAEFRSSPSRRCWPRWHRSPSSGRSACRGGCRSSASR